MLTLVLSGSSRETAAYLRDNGLSIRSHKHVHVGSYLRGARAGRILILPGFEKRRDKHAFLAELRLVKRRHPSTRPEIVNVALSNDDEGRLSLENALLEAYDLEPEGFELSEDPAIQAEQIINSAAAQSSDSDDVFADLR